MSECCRNGVLEDKRVDQLFHELVHVLPVGDVKSCGVSPVFSVFSDELIESVSSAAHCDDFGAFLDKAVGHCGTNAGSGTDHEDVFVLERHIWDRLS